MYVHVCRPSGPEYNGVKHVQVQTDLDLDAGLLDYDVVLHYPLS